MGRLQRRIAWNMEIVVTVMVIIVGAWLTIPRYLNERSMMEKRSVTFASLVAGPLARSADLYRTTGRHILDRQVSRWMELNSDLVVLEVVHVDGFLVMWADHDGVESFPDPQEAPKVRLPEVMAAVRSLELSQGLEEVDDGSTNFRVVVPVVEEWGRRRYSLVAYFSYGRIRRQLIRSVVTVASVLLFALILARNVAVVMASSITSNVERLRDGVGRLQEGHLNERVLIRSGDEVEDLADAFNDMAETLADSIGRLKEANLELEALDQTKADVVANVSHELKTPLTALRGYLELLEHGSLGPLGDEAVRAVAVCRKNLLRLHQRIEELVQLSQWDQGMNLDFVMKEVHIGNMLHEVVETLLPGLEEMGVFCSLSLATDLPSIECNPERVERVFLNLIGNSGKFTPREGSIRVTAEPLVRDGFPGLQVRVADTGIGIPEKALLRIFDRFYQVDPTTRREYGGMGLGLALVQSIVEAHSGAVWVESVEGRGSTFFVWLPLRYGKSGSGVFRALRGEESGKIKRTV
ncbi:MAG: HAMP domain-containing histidine kinase [Thermoanaerobaculales bacterium]|nr:HAMP domain-containing histidine kinase [Thermoanaerobaculales bacterium]